MAILKPKRGSGLPTSLQQNELAVDVLNKRIYLGNAGGTGDIVSSHITDYVISTNGATGAVTILGGTGISVISPSGASNGITLVNQGVLSLNGSTGAVTNVALTNTAQTFTALQSFSSGISASGGTFSGFIRFNSGLSSAGGTFTALTRFTSGLSASGATFTGDVNFSALNGRIIANRQLDITGKGIYLQGISTGAFVGPSTIALPNNGTSLLISCGNGILEFDNSSQLSTEKITTLSFNTFQSQLGIDTYYSKFRIGPEAAPSTNLTYNAYLPADTGTIALTKNVVSSFNGLTGAVTGVTTGTANTFGPLQSFTNGISAAGSTFDSVATQFLRASSLSPPYQLYINDLGGSQCLIGDYSNNNLNTYLVVNDDNGDITLNAPWGIYLNGAPTSSLLIDSQATFTNLPIVGTTASFSGLLTSSGGLSAAGATFSGFARFNAGISAAGGTFSGTQTFVNGATFQGNINAPNIVTSFNGLTGAVTGVTTGTANTFVQLQSFNSGISSAGGTFASQVRFLSGITCSGGATFHTDINVNSVLIGLGGGNVSTNVGIGANALRANTTGGQNIAIGIQSLQFNSTGSQNIGIGRRALNGLNSGGANVGIGSNVFLSLGAGNNCVSLGANSTPTLSTGTGSIYIGAGADSSSPETENEIVIGTSTAGLGSNTTVIGPTTQVSATIRGLVNAPSGLSASGISSGAYILTPSGIKDLTGTTYTFLALDNGTVLTHNNSSGCTFTIPTGLPVGFSTTVIRLNASGRVGFVAAAGVTLNTYGGFTAIAGQHASASLISYSSNIYNLSGNLL